MRHYDLLNFQHIVLFVVPTLIFMVVFGLALAYTHLYSDDAEERKKKIIYRFPEGIEDREAPFPLAMVLIVVGTLLWMVFYILGYGVLDVRM